VQTLGFNSHPHWRKFRNYSCSLEPTQKHKYLSVYLALSATAHHRNPANVSIIALDVSHSWAFADAQTQSVVETQFAAEWFTACPGWSTMFMQMWSLLAGSEADVSALQLSLISGPLIITVSVHRSLKPQSSLTGLKIFCYWRNNPAVDYNPTQCSLEFGFTPQRGSSTTPEITVHQAQGVRPPSHHKHICTNMNLLAFLSYIQRYEKHKHTKIILKVQHNQRNPK